MNKRTPGTVPVLEKVSAIGSGRPSWVRYQVLAFACSLAVVTYIQRLGFSSAAPDIMRTLGLHEEHTGYLMAAFLVAYGLFQVPGGLLGDRLGGRNVLTILVVGWSLVTGMIAMAVFLPRVVALQFGLLLLLRFLFGMLQAGGFPVVGRIMADWMPVTERGFAQGAIWMFSRLGGAVIPFLLLGLSQLKYLPNRAADRGQAMPELVAWLCAFFGRWPIQFLLIGGIGLLWCAAFWPWFRNRPAEMSQVNRGELERIAAGRPPMTQQIGSVPWARMTRSVSVWSLCLMYGFTGFSGNFFTSMLPTYLRGSRHLSEEATAKLSSWPLAAGIFACILGGTLSDWVVRRWGARWGRRTVGGVGLTLAALAFLSTLWVQETWLLGLLFTVTFFCNDLSMGPAWASCADIGEKYAGTLSGAMNMIGALFGAIGAAMAGYLFRHEQANLVFVIFAAVYGLAALCWLGVDARERLADPR
jgi:sugar phosphate permease